MSNVTFETIKEFGQLHKNDKRIIRCMLQQRTSDEGIRLYLQFHEHFLNNEGKLIPRKKVNPNAKFKEEIVSFTLPFNPIIAKELEDIAKKMKDYSDSTPQPANNEEEDPF